jgi:hypothetical protein
MNLKYFSQGYNIEKQALDSRIKAILKAIIDGKFPIEDIKKLPPEVLGSLIGATGGGILGLIYGSGPVEMAGKAAIYGGLGGVGGYLGGGKLGESKEAMEFLKRRFGIGP